MGCSYVLFVLSFDYSKCFYSTSQFHTDIYGLIAGGLSIQCQPGHQRLIDTPVKTPLGAIWCSVTYPRTLSNADQELRLNHQPSDEWTTQFISWATATPLPCECVLLCECKSVYVIMTWCCSSGKGTTTVTWLSIFPSVCSWGHNESWVRTEYCCCVELFWSHNRIDSTFKFSSKKLEKHNFQSWWRSSLMLEDIFLMGLLFSPLFSKVFCLL